MVKRERSAFWICGLQECQKNPPFQNTMHNHLQNCPKFCDHPSIFLCSRHKWITPYVKICCYYNIVQCTNMQMGKTLAATCSKLVKWARSYQISYLFLDLCHLTSTEHVFFHVSLLNLKTCFNKRLFMRKVCLKHSSLVPPFQNLLVLFRTVLKSVPSLKWMKSCYCLTFPVF